MTRKRPPLLGAEQSRSGALRNGAPAPGAPGGAARYTLEGILRGPCGHKHRALDSAVACWAEDEAICLARGGHTDRRIIAVVPGVGPRELTDDEQALVARYRASRGL